MSGATPSAAQMRSGGESILAACLGVRVSEPPPGTVVKAASPLPSSWQKRSRATAHASRRASRPAASACERIDDLPELLVPASLGGEELRCERRFGDGSFALASALSWRKAYLIEYIATQEGVKGDSTGHVIDVGNNTFRGLRLIDPSSAPPIDLAYFEFTDPYADWDWAAVEFYELFNMSADAHQLHNIYNSTPAALRQQLAERLRAEYACAGAGCS